MPVFFAFLAALPAFIQSLPYLFQVALKVMTLLEKLIQWGEKQQLNQWLSDVEKTIDQLESAKTPQEKRAAARSISELIRKLG